MFEQSGRKERAIKIGLLGASFDTSNLGVSALAESSIKIILNKWPNAEIVLLGSGYEPHQHRLSIAGKEIYVRTLPIRFSKNIFLPYHFLWLILYGLIARAFPRSRLKDVLVNRNSCFRLLYETDVVADMEFYHLGEAYQRPFKGKCVTSMRADENGGSKAISKVRSFQY